jgi:hypothetical protein
MDNLEETGPKAPVSDTPMVDSVATGISAVEELAPVTPPPEPQPVLAKAGDILPFTPLLAAQDKPPPVYHFRIPSISDRAAYNREVTRRGAVRHDPGKVSLILRRGIVACMTAENQPALLDVIDNWDRAVAARGAVDGQDLTKIFEMFVELQDDIFRVYPPFAALRAEMDYLATIQSLVCVQMLLEGWDNGPCAFAKTRGAWGVLMVPEEILDLIPVHHWREVQNKAYAYMTLKGHTVKK